MISQINPSYRRASDAHFVRTRRSVSACQIVLIFLSSLVHAQCYASAAESTTGPAMKHLFQAFVGNWRVEETFTQSEFFPKGGSRTGSARFTIDVHSEGCAVVRDDQMIPVVGHDLIAVGWIIRARYDKSVARLGHESKGIIGLLI